MDSNYILSEIASKQKNRIIVRWGNSSVPSNEPLEIKKECWNITITNDPKNYFTQMDSKFKNIAHHSHEFRINKINEGIDIYRDLYSVLNKESTTEIPIMDDVDESKEIFLAIHIHYHT